MVKAHGGTHNKSPTPNARSGLPSLLQNPHETPETADETTDETPTRRSERLKLERFMCMYSGKACADKCGELPRVSLRLCMKEASALAYTQRI